MFENVQCISPADISSLKSPYVIIVIKNDEIVKNIKRQLENLGISNVVHVSDFLEI